MKKITWIAGFHPIQKKLSIQPDTILELQVQQGKQSARLKALLMAATEQGITVHSVEKSRLDARFQQARHQGIAARVIHKTLSEADLPFLCRAQADPMLLILDGVQDPHNLGACLRTADCTGCHAVIVPKAKSCGITPTVAKVACGAAETVPLVEVSNLSRTLQQLQQEGIWLVGTSGQAETELYSLDLSGPIGLIMGGEEKGLRPRTLQQCDFTAKLPQFGQVESLNVSVATGVCLYEMVRQRRV